MRDHSRISNIRLRIVPDRGKKPWSERNYQSNNVPELDTSFQIKSILLIVPSIMRNRTYIKGHHHKISQYQS